MRVAASFRAALLAVAALAAAAPPARPSPAASPATEGANEDLARFRKAFSGAEQPVAERLSAARGLALVDSRDAAELLCRGLAQTAEGVRALAAERSRVRSRIVETQGAEGLKEAPWWDAPTLEKIRVLKEEEGRLRVRDLEEREILGTLRRSLSNLRDARALEFLETTLQRSATAPLVRVAVAEALGAAGRPESVRALRGAAADRDPGPREAAVAALGRFAARDPEAYRALASALEDAAWPVRLAAARGLAAAAVPESVDLLVGRLGREEGRLRRDLASLLSALTGQGFGVEPEGWTRWWAEARAEFVSGQRHLSRDGVAVAAEGGSGPVSYYGITTDSKRILFVIDISGSMLEAGKDPAVSKVDSAKRELLQTLRSLDGESSFTIYAFHDAVRRWKPSLVRATAKAKDEAAAWVKALGAASWTNTFGALEEGFRVSAAAGLDADYGGAADTIFLLTDGAPTTPGGQLADGAGVLETKRVLEAVREWNREKRVVLHAIGIGPSADNVFLGALARENGGRFVPVR